MEHRDPEIERLLAPLRAEVTPLRERDDAKKRRMLPALQSAVRAIPRERARRRARQRLRIGAASLIALAAALAFVWMRPTPAREAAPAALASAALRPSLRVQSQGDEPLSWLEDGASEQTITGTGELRGAGELWVRAGARAALVSAAGAELALSPRSRIRVAEQPAPRAETLDLLEGEVHCRVPPLRAGHSFVIATPRERVVVHGTEFSVRVEQRGQSCVRVREGLVEVRREGETSVWLGPGKAWGCAADVAQSRAPASMQREPPPAKSRPRERRAESAAREVHEQALTPAGTLARETRLLADALRAEQQGDPTRARKLFTTLLEEHPASPLLPEARAGLARLR